MLGKLLDARRHLRAAGMGPIEATVHTPIFYVVGYMHAESIARKTNLGDTDD